MTATLIAPKLMTADDLFDLPCDHMRHELVRGELRTMPPAGFDHGSIGMSLSWRLAHHVHSNSLGAVLLAETGFILALDPDTVRAPDISFVRSDRIPAEGNPKFFHGPPDLAVEVVSPNDTSEEVEDKVLDWLEAGTKLVWVVSPKHRRVTVYRSLTEIAIQIPSHRKNWQAPGGMGEK